MLLTYYINKYSISVLLSTKMQVLVLYLKKWHRCIPSFAVFVFAFASVCCSICFFNAYPSRPS